MIKTNIQAILDEKKKTRYWLVKEMQTTYKTVNKLCDNTLTGIQLETIEKLCRILECSPDDLFTIEQRRLKNAVSYGNLQRFIYQYVIS